MKFLADLLIILQLINGLLATISELNNCKHTISVINYKTYKFIQYLMTYD